MVHVRKLWEIHQCCECNEILIDWGIADLAIGAIGTNGDRREFFFKPDIDRRQMMRKEVILAIRIFL